MKRLHVTNEVRTLVTNRIKECIEAVAKKYGKVLPMPEVVYEKGGTTSGTAHYALWKINLNSVILMENVERFVNRTVPHEFAHLATFRIYPETQERGAGELTYLRNGRVRRAKREVHGPRWQEMMRVLGVPEHEISRTHDYDVTNSRKNVDRTMVAYTCLKCGDRDVKLSAKQHTMARNGTRSYSHRNCGGNLLLTTQHDSLLDKVRTGVLVPVKREVLDIRPLQQQDITKELTADRAPQKIGPQGTSKLAICWGYYKSYRTKYDRQTMIHVFINEADCTTAGASTYYAKCQQLWRDGYI